MLKKIVVAALAAFVVSMSAPVQAMDTGTGLVALAGASVVNTMMRVGNRGCYRPRFVDRFGRCVFPPRRPIVMMYGGQGGAYGSGAAAGYGYGNGYNSGAVGPGRNAGKPNCGDGDLVNVKGRSVCVLTVDGRAPEAQAVSPDITDGSDAFCKTHPPGTRYPVNVVGPDGRHGIARRICVE
jgi:hypothetical protein